MAYTDNPHYQQAVSGLTQFSTEELQAMADAVTEEQQENGYSYLPAILLSSAIQDALAQKEEPNP